MKKYQKIFESKLQQTANRYEKLYSAIQQKQYSFNSRTKEDSLEFVANLFYQLCAEGKENSDLAIMYKRILERA